MITKVQKWGNSLAVRLPKELAETMDFKSGTTVRFFRKGANIELHPIALQKSKNKYTLEELVSGITSKNSHNEFDWGEPVGKEIW